MKLISSKRQLCIVGVRGGSLKEEEACFLSGCMINKTHGESNQPEWAILENISKDGSRGWNKKTQLVS